MLSELQLQDELLFLRILLVAYAAQIDGMGAENQGDGDGKKFYFY